MIIAEVQLRGGKKSTWTYFQWQNTEIQAAHVATVCFHFEDFNKKPVFAFQRGEEQNREEGEMVQKKLGRGRNRGNK